MLERLTEGLVRSADGIWGRPEATREAVSYPERFSQSCFAVEDGSFWFGHRNRVLVSLLERFPPDGVVADVGAGNGFVSAGLLAAGHAVVAVEPSPEGAWNCRHRRHIPDVIGLPLHQAGLRDESLGGVGLFDVLEHVEDEQELLALVWARLKPGGRLYLTVPAYAWLWSREDVAAGHFRRYTRAGLAGCLQRAGFAVEWTSHLFWFLVLPLWLVRALPERLGLSREVEVSQARHRPGGLGGALVRVLCRTEEGHLAAGKPVPFGTSCLAVARKEGTR